MPKAKDLKDEDDGMKGLPSYTTTTVKKGQSVISGEDAENYKN
jgi:hypothetical protein